jgi:hypothetical protein
MHLIIHIEKKAKRGVGKELMEDGGMEPNKTTAKRASPYYSLFEVRMT